MIALSLSELEGFQLGELRVRPGAPPIGGVQIDSRRVVNGDLFVAAGAGGSSYVDDALSRGATAALIPRNEHQALAALGRHVRDRLGARVVAITGSVGKTTTKDIVAALCAPHRRTVAAEASYNNELGVPLTLCRADEQTEVVVAEMGMRGLGQVRELCEIAKPDVGVITSIGPAHLELVGSIDDVVEAKAELLAHLPEKGVAVIPAAERRLERHVSTCRARVVRAGAGGDVALIEATSTDEETNVEVQVEGRSLQLRFNVMGKHNVENAVTAIAVCAALELPLEELQAGADAVCLSPLRSQEIALEGGGLLLNDSYNANPLSMRAAIEHLQERAGERRRVAVLGAMAELGGEEATYHREIGALLAERGVELVIAIGPLAALYGVGLTQAGGSATLVEVETADDAIAALGERLEPGDCVLVKASRAVGLEVVADAVPSMVV